MQQIQEGVITAVAFILVLGILVLIHELGHFLTARLFGVRVEEFGLGFPPRVYPKRDKVARMRAQGKTVYSINALPLGGFVRLAGENGVTPAARASDSPKDGDQAALSLSGDAAGSDDPGAFAAKPAWQRAIILAAGAFNNMVLAMLLVVFILSGIGTPHTDTEVTGVELQSPAYAAGFQPGDVFLRINGAAAQDTYVVRDLISAHAGQSVPVQVLRNGHTVTLSVVPRVDPAPGEGAMGVAIAPVNQHYVPVPLGQAVETAFQLPGNVVQGIIGIFTPQPQQQALPPAVVVPQYLTFGEQIISADRLPDYLGSRNLPRNAVHDDVCLPAASSGSGLTGPIGIIRQVGCEANAVPRQGWEPLLLLVVELSATLAIMNLLPIPALDGGRLLFVLISLVARRRVRPEIEATAHALGMAALLCVILYISANDLTNWIHNKPTF